nr:helix-turn-helix domain-containing protein [Pantoea cypripedii]
MSSKLQGMVWECDIQPLSRKSTLVRLADYSNDEGFCFPSVETIRRQIGAKSKNTVIAAIKALIEEDWLKKASRKIGGRDTSNAYYLNVEKIEAESRAFKSTRLKGAKINPPKFDPSKNDQSEFDHSKSESSNNDKLGVQNLQGEGAIIEPDPLIEPITDPSSKKTVGQLAAPADEQQPKMDYQSVIEAYHEILPEMAKVLELTTGRRDKLRSLWRKFDFTQDRWIAYLRYIAKHCRWMCENRADNASGRTWRKKNFDYLITERCYLSVKEDRANDLPKTGGQRDVNQTANVDYTIPDGWRGA